MKKLMSMLLSLALCLCLLEAPVNNLHNGGKEPADSGIGTVEPKNPEEPVRPMNDGFPGEWDSTVD